jgi:hypothetical protein
MKTTVLPKISHFKITRFWNNLHRIRGNKTKGPKQDSQKSAKITYA